jgi:hypothetical protein
MTPSVMKLYDVSDIHNHNIYKNCCGLLVSQPKRYFLTHLLIMMGLIVYYVVTADRSPVALVVLTVVLNLVV